MTTARDEIDKCDYAYTIQGWIKGVNAQNFSYGLGYFNNDYQGIGSTSLQATPMVNNLYNGNISTMTTHTPAFAQENKPTTFTQQYSYDQLNRITGSTVATQGNVHKTAYSYDANGNIATLKRWNSAGMQFDDMAYKYHKVDEGYLKNTNQLKWVDDAVTNTAAHDDDIEDQDRDNYDYDEIGNLTHDEQEDIERIEWNVYGKVDAVIRKAGSNKVDLYFDYDASGNRVSKTATKNGVSTSTFYVRDATGNTMAVYKKNGIVATKVEEQYIYGSSRLGVYAPGEDVSEELEIGITTNEHNLGRRKYEYSDHLGNVRVVFYDRKQMSMGTIAAAYEYYPFGMSLQSYGNPYRYGFNGKERDEENTSDVYDFGSRIYDARLGRWMSVDPMLVAMPDWSPYNFTFNNPQNYIDEDGELPNPFNLLMDALYRTFIAHTTRDFRHEAAKQNFWQNGGTITRMGRIFEDAVLRSLGVRQNFKIYKTSPTAAKGIKPDFVQRTTVKYVDPSKLGNMEKVIVFPEAAFGDVKFKSNVSLSEEFNPDQLKTMIDVLSAMKGGYENGKWNPNLKASDYGAASLTLITPANGHIHQDLIDYATSKNVILYQRTTEQDIEDPSRIRVGAFATQLNFVKTEEGVNNVILGAGQSVDVDWQNVK